MNSLQYLWQVLRDERRALVEVVREQKLLVLLVLVSLAGAVYYLQPFPPRHLIMVTGRPDGAYSIIADSVAQYVQERGIELELHNSMASLQSAELLANPNGKVDIALIQGGSLDAALASRIYSLGSVVYEPVWIFCRRGQSVRHEHLPDLAALRVGIGPEQGGTQQMVRALFKLNGIEIDGNAHFITGPYAENFRDFQSGELDVLIIVSPVFDPAVQFLLHDPTVELFAFSKAAAYQKALPYISELTLPAFSVDIRKRLPPEDVSLIATTTAVAVKKTLHPDIQTLLLMAARDQLRASHYRFFGKRGEFPAYMDPTVEASPPALHYYDYGVPQGLRYLPFWMAGFVDRMWVLILSIMAVTYPLSKLNVQLRAIRYHIKHRRLYEEVLVLERQLCEGCFGIHEKQVLHDRLTRLNRHAISDHVPVGMEREYFHLLSAIELLRTKAQRLLYQRNDK
ncbi:TAXI family TRAP transporter solute-binding subunit [uncultured Thiodictyon sp.]|uniref:TAXI family TRAP transporter solute-binding subunit n=1 Tax=uncultured Thiodictyon sp. TaxID=1846217 RepID=UPI0025ED39BC|nr:TAXI family TRAP transporter solute-binding subunit [uncultured Thiodictyon sp.]